MSSILMDLRRYYLYLATYLQLSVAMVILISNMFVVKLEKKKQVRSMHELVSILN